MTRYNVRRFSVMQLVGYGLVGTGSLKTVLSSVLIVIALIPAVCQADEGDWQTVGKTTARVYQEMTDIPVTGKFKGRLFEAIRFHVSDGDTKIITASLVLSDGDRIRVNVQKRILAGTTSRTIPVKTGGRTINKVIVYYHIEHQTPAQIKLEAKLMEES